MAIISSDIVFRYSTTSGAAGDTTASTMVTSLGKYVSTTTFSTGTNVTFDNISGSDNAAGTVDYRCIFVLNNHATLTATSLSVYVPSEVAGGAGIAIALDNVATSAKGSSSAQAAQIASETTTPAGTGAFSTPTNDAAGLTIPSLAAGQVKAIWVRRTAGNTAPISGDGYTLGISFDTPD